jgi:uncharacterized membrane protein
MGGRYYLDRWRLSIGDALVRCFFVQSKAYVPIGVGAWLGTIMLFNVWVLIWPNQQKIGDRRDSK